MKFYDYNISIKSEKNPDWKAHHCIYSTIPENIEGESLEELRELVYGLFYNLVDLKKGLNITIYCDERNYKMTFCY